MEELPWSTRAAVADARGRAGTVLKMYRTSMSLSYTVDAGRVSLPESSRPRQSRGLICSWSKSMGRRLRHTIDNCDTDFRVFATLTWGQNAPQTGHAVKAALRALVERARRAGMMARGTWVWWIEFQARGAPHIHLVSDLWIPRKWMARVWAEITGGDERACSRVEGLRKPSAAGSYAAKYAAKQEQKDVPAGFEKIGRFWGMVGALRKRAAGPGGPVPYRTAVLPRRTPGWVSQQILKRWASVRAYDTPVGVTMYGRETALKAIWRWLNEKFDPQSIILAKSSVTTTTTGGHSRLPMLPALSV